MNVFRSLRQALPRLAVASTVARAAPQVARRSIIAAPLVRNFHQAPIAFKGKVDTKIVEFLKGEIAYESENTIEAPAVPKGWEIVDTPRSTEIFLKSKFGNEEILVTFETEKQPDPTMDDMEGEKGADEEEAMTPFAQFTVAVTKRSPAGDHGTLTFELTADSGEIFIDGIVYAKDSQIALSDKVEDDWARSIIYPGPNPSALPEDLQQYWFQYLEERNVNTELAEFIPAYMAFKENEEYIAWLKDVSEFLKK